MTSTVARAFLGSTLLLSTVALCGCASEDGGGAEDVEEAYSGAPADEDWLEELFPPHTTTWGRVPDTWAAPFAGGEVTGRRVTGLKGRVSGYRFTDVDWADGSYQRAALAYLAVPVPFETAVAEYELEVRDPTTYGPRVCSDGVLLGARGSFAGAERVYWLCKEGKLAGVLLLEDDRADEFLWDWPSKAETWTFERTAARQVRILEDIPACYRYETLERARARLAEIATPRYEAAVAYASRTRTWRKLVTPKGDLRYAAFDRKLSSDAYVGPVAEPDGDEPIFDVPRLREALERGPGHDAMRAAWFLRDLRLDGEYSKQGVGVRERAIARAPELYAGCFEAGDLALACTILAWWQQAGAPEAEVRQRVEVIEAQYGQCGLACQELQARRNGLPPAVPLPDAELTGGLGLARWYWEIFWLFSGLMEERHDPNPRLAVETCYGFFTADLRAFLCMLTHAFGAPFYRSDDPQRRTMAFSFWNDGRELKTFDLRELKQQQRAIFRQLAARLFLMLGLEGYARRLPDLLQDCAELSEADRLELFLHSLAALDPRFSPGSDHPDAQALVAAIRASVQVSDAAKREHEALITKAFENSKRRLAESEPLVRHMEAAEVEYPRLVAARQHAAAAALALKTGVAIRDLLKSHYGRVDSHNEAKWLVRAYESRYEACAARPIARGKVDAAFLGSLQGEVFAGRRLSRGADEALCARASAVQAKFDALGAKVAAILEAERKAKAEAEAAKAKAAAEAARAASSTVSAGTPIDWKAETERRQWNNWLSSAYGPGVAYTYGSH